MSRASLEIDRLPLEIVAASVPERAERLARRVREALELALPDALAAVLGARLERDDACVFLERLRIDCAVGANWGDDAIAARFAECIALGFERERELGRGISFRDRAELLSAFLAATADGSSAAHWWLAEFDGLAPLPPAARIRTLLALEPDAGWEALRRLTPQVLARVLGALEEPDAERVLASLPPSVVRELPPDALLDALRSAEECFSFAGARRRLAAVVHASRESGASVSAGLLALLDDVAALEHAAREGRLRAPLEEAHATLRSWCETAGIDAGGRARLAALEPTRLVEQVDARRAKPSEAGASAATSERFERTPFGGALLLCAVLARLGWWRSWRDHLRARGAGAEAEPLAALLALAIAARALDPTRRAELERDPALRHAFGIPEPSARLGRANARLLLVVLRARVEPHGSRFVPGSMRERARALLAELARRIPGCEGSSAAYLRTRCLALPAAVRDDGSAARLGRAPLDVLLVLSGLKRARIERPDGSVLALSEELAP